MQQGKLVEGVHIREGSKDKSEEISSIVTVAEPTSRQKLGRVVGRRMQTEEECGREYNQREACLYHHMVGKMTNLS